MVSFWFHIDLIAVYMDVTQTFIDMLSTLSLLIFVVYFWLPFPFTENFINVVHQSMLLGAANIMTDSHTSPFKKIKTTNRSCFNFSKD